MTDRFQQDLQRAREYIELARPRVHVPEPSHGHDIVAHQHATDEAWHTHVPDNLTEALFGAYTCKRCSSYLHDFSEHEPRQ